MVKAAAGKVVRQSQVALRKTGDETLARILLLLLLEEQLDAGIDQEGSEQIRHPVEAVQQRDSGADEDGTHQDRAEDAPEQHLALQLRWNFEVAEDEQKDEEIVHAECLFHQVAGHEFKRELTICVRRIARHAMPVEVQQHGKARCQRQPRARSSPAPRAGRTARALRLNTPRSSTSMRITKARNKIQNRRLEGVCMVQRSLYRRWSLRP